MNKNSVVEVRIAPFSAAITEPFGISRGTQAAFENVLVAVVLADGTVGYGEASPLPSFNGETQQLAVDALRKMRSVVVGQPVSDWRLLTPEIRATGSSGDLIRSAACALECALLDAFVRTKETSLWKFFGGRQTQLRTDYTVTQILGVDMEVATAHARRAAARAQELGASCLKVKVGGGSVDCDVQRIFAAQSVAPNSSILLDGNAAMSVEDAIELVLQLSARGLKPKLFEQPVAIDDWLGMKEVRSRIGIPVAVDESLTGIESAAMALSIAQVDYFNIKIMKTGIAESLEIIKFCAANGIGLMAGGMVETNLAMTVSASLAAGIGGFSFIDLDTPLFLLESPFLGGARWSGALIDVESNLPGSGIELDGDRTWLWE